ERSRQQPIRCVALWDLNKVTSAGWAQLGAIADLEDVAVGNNYPQKTNHNLFDEKSLEAIARLARLQKMTMGNLTIPVARVFAILSTRLGQLTQVSISGSSFEAGGAIALPQLISLDLTGTKIKGAALARIDA